MIKSIQIKTIFKTSKFKFKKTIKHIHFFYVKLCVSQIVTVLFLWEVWFFKTVTVFVKAIVYFNFNLTKATLPNFYYIIVFSTSFFSVYYIIKESVLVKKSNT